MEKFNQKFQKTIQYFTYVNLFLFSLGVVGVLGAATAGASAFETWDERFNALEFKTTKLAIN